MNRKKCILQVLTKKKQITDDFGLAFLYPTFFKNNWHVLVSFEKWSFLSPKNERPMSCPYLFGVLLFTWCLVSKVAKQPMNVKIVFLCIRTTSLIMHLNNMISHITGCCEINNNFAVNCIFNRFYFNLIQNVLEFFLLNTFLEYVFSYNFFLI